MRRMGVVLLSGGLDSTTVAAYAKAAGHELMALTFNYGQRHSRELEAAKRVAGILEIQHEVVDLPVMKKLSWYSALTTGGLDVPKDRTMEDPTQDIPATYVPLRNTVFLTLGAALLESRVLSLIEDGQVDPKEISASVFIAANAVDYSGYPDCRPEYFEAMKQTLFQGSKLGKQYGVSIGIETPVLRMTKAEIVKLGVELGAPLEHTWSCYEGGDVTLRGLRQLSLAGQGVRRGGHQGPAAGTPPAGGEDC